jgi:hypothetical protein
MEILEVRQFGLTLPKNFPMYRKPPRNEDLIDIQYINSFDFDTLFYDSFFDVTKEEIILIGPTLCNLDELINSLSISTDNGELLKIETFKLHQCTLFKIRLNKNSQLDKIHLLYSIKDKIEKNYKFTIPIGSNYCDFFSDMNVLILLSKNNSLKDISDTININASINGIDSVLFFDNNSDIYNHTELLRHVALNCKIKKFCLVDTPYKYGPQGGSSNVTPDIGKIHGIPIPWDSFFLQNGVLSIAFHRFLKKAKFAIQCDVDELFLPTGKSIFELLQESNKSVIYANPVVIDFCFEAEYFNSSSSFFRIPFRSINQTATAQKYAFIPQRISDDNQLMTHCIRNNKDNYYIDDTLTYRHFVKINTSWKSNRGMLIRFNPEKMFLDCELIKSFRKYNFEEMNYNLEDVISIAKHIGACPRHTNINSNPCYDCEICPFNKK